MRRRLVLGTVAVIVAVLTALVPPVVVLLRRAAERELQVRLNSQATAIGIAIADDILARVVPSEERIARLVPPGDEAVVLSSVGEVLLRFGEPVDSPISSTAAGPGGTKVRMSTSDSALTARIRRPLLALGAFAVGSVALGALLASAVARRLTRPLDALARTAGRLGGGDFSAALPAPSGIEEIDDIAAALQAGAARVDQLLAAERSFTGDAAHQLRTGLAGIGLRLELLAAAADPEVREDAHQAQLQLDRLTRTLDELLTLARGGEGQRADVDIRALVDAHVADWRARLAPLRRQLLVSGGRPVWRVTPGFVGQILDVLLDNAMQHGRGTIAVTVDERSLSVRDEGVVPADQRERLFEGVPGTGGPDPSQPHGRGLVLARRLARADGGWLELTAPTPDAPMSPTTFTLGYAVPALTLPATAGERGEVVEDVRRRAGAGPA